MKAAIRIVAPLLVVSLLGACMRDDPTLENPNPTPSSALAVAIESPRNGARVQGNVVELQASARGLKITEPDGDISGETGHFHAFVDQDPVATGETISDEPGIVHFSERSVRIPGLAVGRHRVTVILGDGSETRIGRTSDSVEVEVTGPSIDATAPEDAPSATGFTLNTTVSGTTVGAPGEGGNHLDIVIDPDDEPEADGRAIPADPTHIHTAGTSHQVTGLPAGEHVIWVILVDENHVPVSPLVADRLVITIR